MPQKKPTSRPAGLVLKDLAEDPSLAAMRRAEPRATNAELLAAVQLMVGVPDLSATRAIRMIRSREKGQTPDQARAALREQSRRQETSRVDPPPTKRSLSVWSQIKAFFS